MTENVKVMIIKALKSKFYQYFVFTKKILQRFVSFCINLIFTYCLFVEKELVTIKIFLLDFPGGQKCGTERQFLLIFLKRIEKYPLLSPQIRAMDTFS